MADFDRILDYLDALRDFAQASTRPVYAETCPCGGSVEVGREATAAERRRIVANFWGRHRECVPSAPTSQNGAS